MSYKTKLQKIRKAAFLAFCLALSGSAHAQLSTNPDKFLGNITTRGSVNGAGVEFATLWNQITPENESKWSSVQGNRSSFSFGGVDNCVNYAKSNKFPFKFHCLLWGAQYPSWIDNLNIYDRKLAIVSWMDEIKSRYRTLDMIDVVNEAVQNHQEHTPIWYDPLGGQGVTGFDWIVRAFEMAHERWPEAILIYNDYNTFQWNTNEFIDLCTKLRDAGAPIDAYGCQSHDLTNCSVTNFKNSMKKIQDALKMPMYITEYDIGTTDDNLQLQRYKEQLPLMWEADYCAGVTLWGFLYGATWTNDGKDANGNTINAGHSGIIKDGKDRPAMKWLREYMASDKAKTATSPYPGMKKPISLYIKPAKYKAPVNEPNTITVDATMHNGSKIEKVELYVNNDLQATMTSAPYTCDVTPTNTTTKINLKAIVYTTDGKTYERLGGFYGSKWSQHPYTANNEPVALPGVLEAENFDMGGETITYHTSRKTAGTTTYREDQEYTGIITTDDGYCLDQPNNGDWYDYTVTATKSASMKYEAIVGTTDKEGASFTMLIFKDKDLKKQVDVQVPTTGRRTFTKVKGNMGVRFVPGEYKIRFLFNGGKVAVDKLYIGVTEEEAAIEDINVKPEGTLCAVYSTAGAVVGYVDIEDPADADQKVRTVTNAPGIYIVKNISTGKSKTIAVK